MWGVRSYVLARKGILASSPDVRNMTRTMWMLEYHALVNKEKEYFEMYFKAMRQLLVGVLGLNAIRPEDESGNPKQYHTMTPEEREDFLPLIAWVGNPNLLKIAADQLKKDIDPDKIIGDQQYEELVAAIDAADGDMDPILGLDKVEVPQNPRQIKQLELLGIKDRSQLDVDVGDI